MLKEYLLNNFEELDQLVTAIHAYNGELEHLMFYENDEEFFDTYFYNKPMEAVRAVQYGDYNYNDPYVQFDGYMNLVSYDTWQYKEALQAHIDEIIEQVYNIKDECNWIDEEIVELVNE